MSQFTQVGNSMGYFATGDAPRIRLDLGKLQTGEIDSEGTPLEVGVHATYFFDTEETANEIKAQLDALLKLKRVAKVRVTNVRRVVDVDKTTGAQRVDDDGNVQVILRQAGNKRPVITVLPGREKGDAVKTTGKMAKLLEMAKAADVDVVL